MIYAVAFEDAVEICRRGGPPFCRFSRRYKIAFEAAFARSALTLSRCHAPRCSKARRLLSCRLNLLRRHFTVIADASLPRPQLPASPRREDWLWRILSRYPSSRKYYDDHVAIATLRYAYSRCALRLAFKSFDFGAGMITARNFDAPPAPRRRRRTDDGDADISAFILISPSRLSRHSSPSPLAPGHAIAGHFDDCGEPARLHATPLSLAEATIMLIDNANG